MKLGLDPDSVHDLIVFPVLNLSIDIFTLNSFKTNAFEESLNLLNREVVSSSLVQAHVEILLDF